MQFSKGPSDRLGPADSVLHSSQASMGTLAVGGSGFVLPWFRPKSQGVGWGHAHQDPALLVYVTPSLNSSGAMAGATPRDNMFLPTPSWGGFWN